MNIGVPKERKTDESRVALRPEHVPVLKSRGHNVLVETQAGKKAGFDDRLYERAGAKIVDCRSVYAKSKLIVKVKCPIGEEYDLYKDGQILFSYLHFDGNEPAENYVRMARTGVSAVAYEWVQENGELVLLKPMSELAGTLAALKTLNLLMENAGLLPGGYLRGLAPAKVMVIGCGRIGCNAVKVFIMNGLNVTVVDKRPQTLVQRLQRYMTPDMINSFERTASIIHFNEQSPEKALAQIRWIVPKLRIVICAADRRPTLPKSRCRYIMDRDTVALLPAGSVICDATATLDGFIETCVPTEGLNDHYVEESVVHYNCDHIPALTPHSSTILLTDAAFPYLLELAEGFEEAVKNSAALRQGVMCFRGYLTHRIATMKKNLSYTPLESLLKDTLVYAFKDGRNEYK
jgi:alanine dehydrogenase